MKQYMDIPQLISVAKSQLNVRENGGNNKGADIEKYQGATWLKPGPWPWCAAFVAWCVRQCINTIPACKDASAFGWIKWAKVNGLYITDEKELAKAGDLIIFDFSHIGIVIEDQQKGKKIHTIEGNTEPNKQQRDGNADGVYEMWRSPSLVKAFIRFNF